MNQHTQPRSPPLAHRLQAISGLSHNINKQLFDLQVSRNVPLSQQSSLFQDVSCGAFCTSLFNWTLESLDLLQIGMGLQGRRRRHTFFYHRLAFWMHQNHVYSHQSPQTFNMPFSRRSKRPVLNRRNSDYLIVGRRFVCLISWNYVVKHTWISL